jgi:hypothetical protein
MYNAIQGFILGAGISCTIIGASLSAIGNHTDYEIIKACTTSKVLVIDEITVRCSIDE